MARQNINVGAAPNDGTGDPLRTAMIKSNDNFIELYEGRDAVTVANFAALPAPDATNSGERWWVLASTGVWLVNRQNKGAYYSNGTTWSYLGDFPQTGSEVTNVPAGSISAVTVQAAINELDGDVTALTTATATAAHVTSGTFADARIPDLDAAKITTGILAVARGGTGIGTYTANNYVRALSASVLEQRTPAQVLADVGAQEFDAGLQSIAGLTTVADRGIYTTASDTYAVFTLTAAGRAILDDADATAQRATLGLGTAAIVNTGASGATIPLLNGVNTWSATQIFSQAPRLANNIAVSFNDLAGVQHNYLILNTSNLFTVGNTNHAMSVAASSTNFVNFVTVGNNATTSDALVRGRRGGNIIEFGHPSTAYMAVLGAEAGSGAPFLVIGGEGGTNSNTYRTRGNLGGGVKTDNAGGLVFFTLTNSNADNQAPTTRMTLLASGEMILTDVGPTSTLAAGYRGHPQNRQDISYTLVLADAGKSQVAYGVTTLRIWTIPSNASVAYPIGTILTFCNMRTVPCSIAVTTDTMYLAETGTTGTRTLSSRGFATAIKTDTTNWLIYGTGLT